MSKTVRVIGFVLFAVLLVVFLRLPDARVTGKLSRFEGLKEFDFVAASASAWTRGERERALALNEYAVVCGQASSASQRAAWLAAMAAENTTLSRLRLLGRGGATGEGSAWEDLAGQSLAEFFLTGEVWGLGKELGFGAATDKFATSLASAGLLTEIFQPAKACATLLKAAKREGAVSEPLSRAVVAAARQARPNSRASLRPLWDVMIPVWELAKNCKTWSELKTALRSCTSVRQVKVMTALMSSRPGNSKRLEQILSVVRESPRLSGKVIAYVHDNGDRGLANLHNGLRKGPSGVKVMTGDPAFVARPLASVRETRGDNYAALLLKYGTGIRVLRFALLTVVVACMVFLARPWKMLGDFGVKSPESSAGLTLAVVLVSAVICLLLLLMVPSGALQVPAARAALGAGQGRPNGPSGWSFACFLVALLLQLWALIIAQRKLDQVRGEVSQPISVKLAYLDNLDTYFDLPLYLGLAGSVAGFMLLTFQPMGGRVLAYSSTVVGIFVSLFLKVRLLLPYRQELIKQQAAEEGKP